ncbi:MAG: hypothetical protein M3235_16105 [Actinomycetota bacterium]|nr:hypothetical protein [Actinomycetota bacterium]
MPDRSGRPFWADDDYTTRKPLPVPGGGIQIHATRGTIARTWWSARFLDVLAELGVGGRLSRGRTYARSGQIVSLDVAAGAAVALVQGTRPTPYRVRIGVRTWDKAEWTRVEQALADDAWYAAALLAGAMPPEVEELLGGLGLALFPESGTTDLSMDCTCPDATVPCKHLAAAFYLLAERFDADPFEILTLRGRDRETLLENLRSRRGTGREPTEPSAPPASVPPLADVLDRFWTSAPVEALPPAPPATSPDAVLDQVPELPVRVRGKRVTDLLRPAYERIADE